MRALTDIPAQDGHGTISKHYLCDVGMVQDNGYIVIKRDEMTATVHPDQVEQAHRAVNGTFYNARAPKDVITLLEMARAEHWTLRLHYGDAETGRDWLEEHDMLGRIGRSTGRIRIPLIIAKGEDGGLGLLEACIVKIRRCFPQGVKRMYYQHPLYHHGKITLRGIKPGEKFGKTDMHDEGYRFAVDVDGKNQANFKDKGSANNYLRNLGIALEAL